MWYIRFLGTARIDGSAGPLSGRSTQRARLALIALVAASRTRSASRERLMSILWPEADPDRARHLLRDSLYRLRSELGDKVLPGVGDEVRLDADHVAVDLWDFERAAAAETLETADRLYTGPFLDGMFLADSIPFERWVDEERHRLAVLHGRVLEKLANARADAGDWLGVVALRRRLVGTDPSSARLALAYMEALEAVGDRAAAIGHAEAYARLLRSELDAAADPAIEAFAERLRHRPRPGPRALRLDELTVRSSVKTASSSKEEPAPAAAAAETPRRSVWRRSVPAAFGACVALAIAMTSLSPRGTATSVDVGSSMVVTTDPGIEVHGAMSPDTKLIAYAAGRPGQTGIFVRSLSGGRAIPVLPDSTLAVQMYPRWSPDGSRILVSAPGHGVFVIPSLGGPPQRVTGIGNSSWGTWSPDGSEIAFTRGDTLFARAVDHGTTRVIGVRGRYLHACDWSRQLPLIACAVGNWEHLTPTATFGNTGPSAIVLIPAAGGVAVPLTDSMTLNTSPAWDPRGRRLFFVSNRHGPRDIYVQHITKRGEPDGYPVRVTSGLNAHSVTVTPDGERLLYSVYTASANVFSVMIPDKGAVSLSNARAHTTGTQVVERMNVSADGQWLYYDSNLRGNSDIYRVRVSGGEPERLTNEAADEYAPVPSPNAPEVAFYSLTSGNRDIYVMPSDGGPTQRVTSTPEHEFYPQWSLDGRVLAYSTAAPTFSTYLVRRRPNGDWDQPELRASMVVFPQWSPDGRRLLVQKRGSPGLFALPVDSGPAGIIFADTLPGGGYPTGGRWSPTGKLIYVRHSDRQRRVSFWAIGLDDGTPHLLVRLDDRALTSSRPSWTTDGKRFFFLVDEHRSDVWIADIEAAVSR